MTQLRDDIISDFGAIEREWSDVHNKTKSKVSTMQNYYTNIQNTSEAVQRADSYRNDLTNDLNKHDDLASRAINNRRNLNVQVQSSENRVKRMTKYGRPAAFFFALLGAAIGAAVGYKAPAWGQAVTTAVGGVLGFIAFGVFGLFLYFVLKCIFIQRRDEWEEAESLSQGGLANVHLINEKKSGLREIRTQLHGMEEGNMGGGRAAFLDITSGYLS